MTKAAIITSWICLLIVFAASLWIWHGLPDLPHYPIHWGADGQANGFGSKNSVFINLLIMPITMVITFIILVFTPKLEPKKTAFLASSRPFAVVWIALMIFFTIIHMVIIQNYLFLDRGSNAFLFDPFMIMAVGSNILFIVIGNVMGKVRQNYMFGIRTPWTLSSKQTWDKTHRTIGPLMVALGVIGLLSLFFLSPLYGMIFSVGLLPLVLVIAVFVVSYNFWKDATDKSE